MPIALIIALIAAGGLSAVAAETSLPGEALYSVKVSINEKVRSGFAVSNEAEARWQARQVGRRIEEAEILVLERSLDAKARTQIQSGIKEHSESFRKEVAEIESEGRLDMALEIQSEFESSLKAHEVVLTEMSSEDTELAIELSPILSDLRTLSATVSETRNALEAKISSSSETESEAETEVGSEMEIENKESIELEIENESMEIENGNTIKVNLRM